MQDTQVKYCPWSIQPYSLWCKETLLCLSSCTLTVIIIYNIDSTHCTNMHYSKLLPLNKKRKVYVPFSESQTYGPVLSPLHSAVCLKTVKCLMLISRSPTSSHLCYSLPLLSLLCASLPPHCPRTVWLILFSLRSPSVQRVLQGAGFTEASSMLLHKATVQRSTVFPPKSGDADCKWNLFYWLILLFFRLTIFRCNNL